MRILIAEDDPNILKPYKVALNARNHEVFVTDNGEDCLRIYQEEQKNLSRVATRINQLLMQLY